MANDWEGVHRMALRSVDKDMGIKYFRRCGIDAAGINNIMTSDEEEKVLKSAIVITSVAVCVFMKNRIKRRRS